MREVGIADLRAYCQMLYRNILISMRVFPDIQAEISIRPSLGLESKLLHLLAIVNSADQNLIFFQKVVNQNKIYNL